MMDRTSFTFARDKVSMPGRTVALYAASVTLLVAASLLYIYPSIQATSLMYEYAARMHTLEDLKELNKKLVLETAALRSYDFIEEQATKKFGFVFPEQGQVVIIAKK